MNSLTTLLEALSAVGMANVSTISVCVRKALAALETWLTQVGWIAR